MTGPAPEAATAARRSFIESQVAMLEPLAFVVIGVPAPPFDAIQIRREEDDSFVLEIAARDESVPFTEAQQSTLRALGFTTGQGRPTWVGPAAATAAAAVATAERVLVDVVSIADMTPIDVRHGSIRDERAAEIKLGKMRAFIEPVLEKLLEREAPQDPDGDYLVDIDGVRVFVAPRAMPGRPPVIRVFAITNAGLNLTPELGLFLSRLNFSLAFGRFSVDMDHRAVWFDETLLGDHVTEDELTFVVRVVAGTAAEWDEKIASMFGGTYRTQATTSPQPTDAGAPPRPAKPGEGGYL